MLRKKPPLKFEVIDKYFDDNTFSKIYSENKLLHSEATHNKFFDLSYGKTTVRELKNATSLASVNIILNALTSEATISKISTLLGTTAKIYTLLDFDNRAGHSFFHRMFPGSFLGLHVDRSYMPETRMVKVANAIFYASPRWSSDFGGHLYLRNGILGPESHQIEYLPNRLVLLAHNSMTFHGVSRLSSAAETRFSAYMDYYLPLEVFKELPTAKQVWCHDTVYLPEANYIQRFFRGSGYSKQLIKYLRRKEFDV